MRSFVLALLVAGACAPSPNIPATALTPEQETVRRLTSILDYVAADYVVAVKDGVIVSEAEYAEQLVFLKDASELAAKIPGAPEAVAAVAAMVEARKEPEVVAAAARELRRKLIESSGLVLAPAAPPSRTRGAELYAQMCAACHGARGGGDGPSAAGLDPKPRSFLDPAVMGELTPARAFNTLTDGVKGTGMASFGTLAAADRWALAFHVFTLRHDAEAIARGEKLAGQAPDRVALAGLPDDELAARHGGLDGVAYLRSVAAFTSSGSPLAAARRGLADAVAAARRGDEAAARQAIGAAYLDGFEPLEGALRGRDEALVVHIEERFLDLREHLGRDARDERDELDEKALQLEALLDRAEETLAGSGGAGVAFASALVVFLREGVEAALLIMLLLGLARRAARPEDAAGDARAVHMGWIASALLGVATWFASGPLVALGGARRELIEGVVALLASVVLLATGHFVLARLDARQRVEGIKRRLAAAPSGARRRLVLGGLAFVAVYREAFEVVLFLRAIALDAGASAGAVAGGVAAGALLLVGVVALLLRLGKRLQPGPLLASMGTLLCVLAVILAGKGVRSLQEAGVVPIHPIDVPRLDWLGLFGTAESVAAQLFVLLSFVTIAVLAVRARRPPLP